ncbi:MAG: hypothetical protein HY362_00155 [Candidatus Aenigmarchaeota archaeon]|nr:hypothetical protein [Candidatus Aenigmarchaeota archaeon]
MDQPQPAKSKWGFKFPTLTKKDKIGIVLLLIFLILINIPAYFSTGKCEVARAGFKCAKFTDVLKENCEVWANYSCNTAADVSFPSVEWYIGNMCRLQSQNHGGITCTNLKETCNSILQKQACSA